MFRTLLCFLIFFLSSLGYWEFLRSRMKLDFCFLPVLTVAIQFCILLSAGLLNILPETAIALYAGGLLLLAAAFRKQGCSLIRPYLSWSSLFFLCILAIWILAARSKILCAEDDFAHWGIVIKKMLETNRLPNFTDEVIGFRKYPLGSSLWIWFFCFPFGGGEDIMLMAQGYMLLCCLLPWCHAVTRNRILCTVLISLGLCVILDYNIPLDDLTVDTLLPLAGMASFYFILCHCRNTPKGLFLAVPLLVWTAQIKNSGLLFALVGSVLILSFAKKGQGNLLLRAVCAASPFAGFFLWSRHCDLVFADPNLSKHAVSAESYAVNLSLKTAEEIRTILTSVTEYVLTRNGLVLSVIYLIVLGVLTFLLFRNLKKEFVNLSIVILGFMLVYYVGICGMYLLSMPTKEALMLAAIERYMRTLDIALWYLMMIYSLHCISAADKPTVAVLACTAVLCFWSSLFSTDFFHTLFEPDENPDLTAFQQVLEEHGIQPGTRCIITLKGYRDYHFFLCRYLLDTTPLCLDVTSAEQLDASSDYDILINLDAENPIISEWITQNYPRYQGQQVVLMYD